LPEFCRIIDKKTIIKMKYLTLLLALAVFSCSTDSSQNTEATDTGASLAIAADNSSTESESLAESAEEATTPQAPIIIIETVEVKESDIKQNEEVRAAFLNMVDVVNNATSADIEKVIALLDEEYAFKGRDLEANSARITQSLGKFSTTNTDVKIEDIHSSCDLAYIIASYKRTLTDRETGEVKVDARNKVGLFIMRKDAAGVWKLLVQKTDDGFAHWYYMPQETS